MENKEIYNIKGSDLDEINFLDGTWFAKFSLIADDGRKIDKTIMIPSPESAISILANWTLKQSQIYLNDPLKFHSDIVDWLLENWLEDGVVSLKNELSERYAFEELKNQDPKEWIKTEPEIAILTLVHIASNHTNGYIKLPVNNLELTVKYVKKIIGINFWDN